MKVGSSFQKRIAVWRHWKQQKMFKIFNLISSILFVSGIFENQSFLNIVMSLLLTKTLKVDHWKHLTSIQKSPSKYSRSNLSPLYIYRHLWDTGIKMMSKKEMKEENYFVIAQTQQSMHVFPKYQVALRNTVFLAPFCQIFYIFKVKKEKKYLNKITSPIVYTFEEEEELKRCRNMQKIQLVTKSISLPNKNFYTVIFLCSRMRYGGKKNLSSPSDKELKLKLLMFIPCILSVSVFFQLYLSSGFTSSHKKQQPQK